MTSGTRVGTVIEEKYRLDEQIGHGSMGAVYRGTQLMVDRSVAVKLLHPTFAGHEQIQARFEVEAKAIARLNHPNCITLFDFGYSEDMEAFYTVVEFIDGIPLGDLVNQRPSVQRIVELVRQMASALGHAHHHGILHRDLKPENIMLATMTDGREVVKVLDFGIAQIMKGTAEEEPDDDFETDRITRVGEVFGTPPYMSPEQCESARDLTPATDLYSLGIMFYELLEGRLPFFADTPVEIMRMHINDAPPPMKRSGVPKPLQKIVLQMLAKDPEERPDSGDQIVEMLDAIPEETLTSSSPVASASGEARGTDPTLLSSPPTSDTIIVDDAADDDVGDVSEIYELKDLVADQSPPPAEPDPANQPTEPDLRPPSQAPQLSGHDSDVSTTSILDTGAQEVKALASKIAAEERKMLGGIIAVVLLIGAAMIWVIVVHEPFSMADEDDLSTIAEYASGPHSDDEQNDQTTDAIPPIEDSPIDEAPPEVSIADEERLDEHGDPIDDDDGDDDGDDEDIGEDDEDSVDGDELDDEADAPDDPPSAPRPRPSTQEQSSEPSPAETAPRQPPRLGVDDEVPESDGADEADDEQPSRGPPRLGL